MRFAQNAGRTQKRRAERLAAFALGSIIACIAMAIVETTRDAKEFLIEQIIAEAELEGLQLSEIERKMLYFSETAWTLPDIYEVNEAFDATYDAADYELKIANLIRNRKQELRRRDTQAYELWKRSVKLLENEDHYLLVLLGVAEGKISVGDANVWKRWVRILLIIAIGTAAGLAAIATYVRLHD